MSSLVLCFLILTKWEWLKVVVRHALSISVVRHALSISVVGGVRVVVGVVVGHALEDLGFRGPRALKVHTCTPKLPVIYDQLCEILEHS